MQTVSSIIQKNMNAATYKLQKIFVTIFKFSILTSKKNNFHIIKISIWKFSTVKIAIFLFKYFRIFYLSIFVFNKNYYYKFVYSS